MPVSSAIHNLENELGGVKLFEKSGRNIRLTDEGKFYQEKVDAALNELHTASLILRDSKISAPVVIRMGFISGTLDGLVAQKIAEYSRNNTRIRFHLTESSASCSWAAPICTLLLPALSVKVSAVFCLFLHSLSGRGRSSVDSVPVLG